MPTTSDSRQERVMPFGGIRLIIGCFSSLVAICLFLCPSTKGQTPPGQGREARKLSNLMVDVRMPDGTPLDLVAMINLYDFGHVLAGFRSVKGGQAEFRNLAAGNYIVEVIAPGYEKLTETVGIEGRGESKRVSVTLTSESTASANNSPPEPPVLAPNSQKEFNKALEAMRGNKGDEARKYLEKLSRAAPSNPDVNYLWGVYYSRINNWTLAKSYWEKAAQLYPHHALALSALAQLAIRQNDLPSAIGYFSRAAEADPSSWRFEQHLADAYLRNKDYAQAQKHAEHAIELGKDRADVARLILAQALANRNDKPRAIKTLETFLVEQPSDSYAAAARQLINNLQKTESSPEPPIVGALPLTNPAAIAAEMTPPPKWMPPDVDENMPAVEPGVACPLEQVRDEAAKRVHDFIESVNKITATEKVENELLDRSGFPSVRESRSFSYVVGIQEIRKGILDVEEYRNGSVDPELFPQHIASIGLPSLVLAFHPDYKDDFEVSCEGLSRWGGGFAWQVHLRQKPSKPSRLRGYRVGGRLTPVSLRGRAWIAADTYQVVRLETDIVSPLPEIRLKAEHISVDYGPVAFRKYNTKLWLPQTAELYFDFNGRRMHRRHQFSKYLLFAVDEREKISDPKIPVDADPSASPSPR